MPQRRPERRKPIARQPDRTPEVSSCVPDLESGLFQTDAELQALHHRLTNQLGIILAHAELLEDKVLDEVTRARAARIVAGALQAIGTARPLRQRSDAAAR